MNSTLLLWGVVFSSIGLGYFVYGKKQVNPLVRYTGVALMLFPYFIDSSTLLVLVGLALMALPNVASRYF
ncbi:MAG: hypothetical protein ACJA13_002120 [Paraglaciecola sp.]|jgi:hypothetical protein